MRFVDLIHWVDDFPVAGVRFADLTPAFADAAAFAEIISSLADVCPEADIVAGVDARGFLLAGGVAAELGLGTLAIRKGGKLPPPVHSRQYALEYGTATLEIPQGVDLRGKRVLLIDDVVATGGTIAAAAELLRAVGAAEVRAGAILELSFLEGRAKLGTTSLSALLTL